MPEKRAKSRLAVVLLWFFLSWPSLPLLLTVFLSLSLSLSLSASPAQRVQLRKASKEQPLHQGKSVSSRGYQQAASFLRSMC